ncbi:MAG: ATP-binding protein [Acidimicrobiia bacterium]
MNEARRGLSARLLAVYTLAFLVIIGIFGAVVDRAIRRQLLDDLTASLVDQASVVEVALQDRLDLDSLVNVLADRTDSRITVIAVDGRVMADSDVDAAVMGNHADRPEVVTALTGQVGVARRHSSSTDQELLYVALPPNEGRMVRVALPEATVAARLQQVRMAIIAGAVFAGLVGVAVVWLIARRIARPLEQMIEAAEAVADGKLFTTAPRTGTRELDRMGVALDRMATELVGRIEASEAQARLLDQTLGAVGQGVIVVGVGDAIVYANSSARSMIRLAESLSTLTPHGLQTLVRQARSSGAVVEARVDYGSPVRNLRAVATPFPGDQRVLLAVTDVTERARVEAMRRDFVASASHELKTPVAAILASTEALQLALARDASSAGRFGEQIERSAHQLAKLVADLLDLSRLESHEPEHELFRLGEVAEEELARVRPFADDSAVTLTASVEDLEFHGSRRDLGLAIRNLLDNAIRHTAGGKVVLTLARRNGDAVVEVTDNGEGIPRRELSRIFERFYRVDSARSRATGGTGLGLAIVRHIVERHGGSVEVESELGRGSTFRLTLPFGAEE